MADKSDYVENNTGVHLINGEFTACGWAFDAPFTEEDCEETEFLPTSKRTITCPDCIAVIKHYRGVRVKE